ncbi:integrase core domain-containing protein [Lentzea sp. BCCO 10_0856]|uniref:Integrase core domain-containing protein n=1 Tax=Lentzea miocenica TaxID=3095431 RepID=A0ABU4THI2_9PSEU|nr:integrase core domain-containing protein [Lentzea sp. BCCO 10_0856]MDX8037657.1 integrase core domain-containing protein [Lentzea sp. BCCO 10_0856]
MARKEAMMRLMDAMHAAGVDIPNVSEWCRVNGVDRRTFYRHRARARAEGQWQPRSRRPHTIPHATPEPVVAEIVRLRETLAPDNGADYIRDALTVLATEQGWSEQDLRVPSRATINRILARHGLLEINPRKRPRSSWRRFSYARPRDCYQIDATETVLADGAKVVVFDVLDDHSRLLVACHAAHSETSAAATAAITAAFTGHGVPGIVLSDNGGAFTARHLRDNAGPTRFELAVTGAGARLIHSSPYHPQTCGKVERHHQTLKKWLAHQPAPTTLAELQTLLDTHRVRYNTLRGHSALGRRTPQHVWDHAQHHGGPSHPPAQTDATVHHLTADRRGVVSIGRKLRFRTGSEHAGQAITVIRDLDRVTAYTSNGHPIGYIHLDHTKTYQGTLTPAA